LDPKNSKKKTKGGGRKEEVRASEKRPGFGHQKKGKGGLAVHGNTAMFGQDDRPKRGGQKRDPPGFPHHTIRQQRGAKKG